MKRLVELLHGTVAAVRTRFAVAHGFATNCWVCRLGARDLVWHGFDHFTGIPGARREYSPDAFDVGGKPPVIDDARRRCYLGNVEDTLGTVDLVNASDTQWQVLFNMDISEPTAFAREVISPQLRPRDVICPDEAGIEDERRAGDLTNADVITDQTFWVGTYPGLTNDHLEYVAESIELALAGMSQTECISCSNLKKLR